MASAEGASAPLYIITSFIWDDEEMVESLQQPEAYHNLTAANDAARDMMDRYAAKLKLPKNWKKWNFDHSASPDGSYIGVLACGSNGHVGARVRVFKTTKPGDPLPQDDGEVVKEDEEEDELLKEEAESATRVAVDVPDVDDEMVKDEDESKAKIEIKAPSEEKESKVEEDDEVKEEEEEEEVEEKKPTRAKMKKTAVVPATHRKKIPAGKPNCLEGLKLLFTGTFETMDRKTSVATAITYGAQVITKLEDTDYIVLGTRAGPKKLQEINEKELETITEEEFFQILENGVPQEKRDRMAARQAADEDEEPEEEEEKPAPKRKGPAAAASTRKRTKK
ncbi:hypothetical protein PG989_013884 [Apiospora arundinis]